MKNERWKPVKGYEGHYEISDHGRVKSLKRNIILKTRKNRDGYRIVNLSENGKQDTFLVHRLMGISFIPNLNNLRCINHLDGIKENNVLDNIEWVTHSENLLHAYKIGLRLPTSGENNGMSTLTNKEVLEIRDLKGKYNQTEIGDLYGISQPAVSGILSKNTWASI